jgi:hypothetical protein
MNAKRMQLALIALATYTAIALFGIYAAPQNADSNADAAADVPSRDVPSEKVKSAGGTSTGFEVSIEWHSLLPGSLK